MRGVGKIAMSAKTIGRSNQPTELLMVMEFRRREMTIIINKIMAAIVISI